jgi:hypothetical protein
MLRKTDREGQRFGGHYALGYYEQETQRRRAGSRKQRRSPY